MIERIERELKSWAEDIAKEVAVSFDSPGAAGDDKAIHVHLLEVADAPTGLASCNGAWEVCLRYLVTAPLASDAGGRAAFGALLFAALERSDLDVDLRPREAALWSALGTTPRAAFVVGVRVRRARVRKTAPLVTQPMRLRAGGVRGLSGRVRGPDDIPVADALVEIPSLGMATRSDHNGQFHFAAVPPGLDRKALRVTVKGREIEPNMEASAGKALVQIQLHSEED